MNIEIRKLTPGLAEEYVRFFDTTPFDTYKEEDKCYCVTWRHDDTYDMKRENPHWFPTREERRARALEFVRAGKLQGYLAYCDGEIVGWCNATADCQGGVNHLRSYYPIEEARADVKVKSIFCFFVAVPMYRKGVATRLVERICEDAADDGFDFVEAYPDKEYKPGNCRGPLAMYEKCGFVIRAERDGRVVVRKALK